MHVRLHNGHIEAASLFLKHKAEPTVSLESEDKDEWIHFALHNAHVGVAH